MEAKQKIWLVGASSGIGLELVKILLANGHYLIVSSRNAKKSQTLLILQEQYKSNLYLLNIDVKQDDFTDLVAEAWHVYGGLDIWFYNVGSYEVMSLDEWDKDKFISMNETNYLGAVKIMNDILPFFRDQKSGKWIWNLSLSSYFGLPKGGGYSAPKAALLNLAESIQPELLRENINLQIINHGFVKTRLTAKNDFDMPQLMTPEFCAKKIYEAMDKANGFEISFPFGLGTFLRVLSILPYKISLAITKRMLK
jgi:short-subunit dehydrogenase